MGILLNKQINIVFILFRELKLYVKSAIQEICGQMEESVWNLHALHISDRTFNLS